MLTVKCQNVAYCFSLENIWNVLFQQNDEKLWHNIFSVAVIIATFFPIKCFTITDLSSDRHTVEVAPSLLHLQRVWCRDTHTVPRGLRLFCSATPDLATSDLTFFTCFNTGPWNSSSGSWLFFIICFLLLNSHGLKMTQLDL